MAEAHHYVSRCYLNGFTAPTDARRPTAYLHVADLDAGTVRRRAPRKVAHQVDYYAIPLEDGGVDYSIERHWGKVETGAAPVLKQVREGAALAAVDHSWLVALAAVHFGRVPAKRETFRQWDLEIARTHLEILGFSRPTLEKALRDPYPDKSFSPSEIDDLQQEIFSAPKRYELSAAKHAGLRHTVRAVEIANETFRQMSWEWLTAPLGSAFLTSDCPVTAYNPKHTEPWDHGLRNENTQVAFPITPTICLFASWNGIHLDERCLEAAQVTAINERTAYFATRHCFSHSDTLARWALTRRKRPAAGA
jgi:Protein of unknown function (DUF4238)